MTNGSNHTMLRAAFVAAGMGWGCTGASPGQGGDSVTGSSATRPTGAPVPVTLRGDVVAANGAGIAGAQIFDLPLDPYLRPLLRADADPRGSFVLTGANGDSREWLIFDRTGYAGLYVSFDTSLAPVQTVPPATLLADAGALAFAGTFGVSALDPERTVLRIPVVVQRAGAMVPAGPRDFQVAFQPALDVPVQYADGEAVAFNAPGVDSFQVTVTRGGRLCAPLSRPTLVAADGSMEVRTLPGIWTLAPTVGCPD